MTLRRDTYVGEGCEVQALVDVYAKSIEVEQVRVSRGSGFETVTVPVGLVYRLQSTLQERLLSDLGISDSFLEFIDGAKVD